MKSLPQIAPRIEQMSLVALIVLAVAYTGERVNQTTQLATGPRSAQLVQGVPFTNLRLLLLAVILLWLLALVAAGRRPRIPRRLALPMLAWLGVLFASAIGAPSFRVEAIRALSRPLTGLLVAWVVYDLAQHGSRMQVVARALALSGVIVAALGLAQAAGVSPIVEWLEGFRAGLLPASDLSRITSTPGHPNMVAIIIDLTLPLLLVWALALRRPLTILVLCAAVFIDLTALVLTFSRAGIAAMIVSLGVIGLIAAGNRQRPLVLSTLGTVGGLLIVLGVVLGFLVINGQPLGVRLGADLQGGYSAKYESPAQLVARPGEVIVVPVRITNFSSSVWSATGTGRFALGYHLNLTDGKPLIYEGLPTPLVNDLLPGASEEVQAQIVSPRAAGTYIVDWDGLQDGGAWFSWRGTPAAPVRLTVAGDVVAPGSEPFSASSEGIAMPTWSRLQCWSAALLMFRDWPVLGVGLDNFTWRFEEYSGLSRGDACFHAHNLYLETLADSGVIGLFALVWVAVSLFRAVGRPAWTSTSIIDATERRDHQTWFLQVALTGALVAWFLHGAAEYFPRFWPTSIGFWLLIGLVACDPEPAARRIS